jgi:hypothetical protein
VSNGNGAVVHVTQKLAALLGRTVQQVLANNTAHALEQLMVEPFSQLHRTLAASIPQTAPPAHSCRSGVSFLMNELGAQGRTKAAPFRMSLKRQMHGDDALHVMCFEKRTLEQVGSVSLPCPRLFAEVNCMEVQLCFSPDQHRSSETFRVAASLLIAEGVSAMVAATDLARSTRPCRQMRAGFRSQGPAE